MLAIFMLLTALIECMNITSTLSYYYNIYLGNIVELSPLLFVAERCEVNGLALEYYLLINPQGCQLAICEKAHTQPKASN